MHSWSTQKSGSAQRKVGGSDHLVIELAGVARNEMCFASFESLLHMLADFGRDAGNV